MTFQQHTPKFANGSLDSTSRSNIIKLNPKSISECMKHYTTIPIGALYIYTLRAKSKFELTPNICAHLSAFGPT